MLRQSQLSYDRYPEEYGKMRYWPADFAANRIQRRETKFHFKVIETLSHWVRGHWREVMRKLPGSSGRLVSLEIPRPHYPHKQVVRQTVGELQRFSERFHFRRGGRDRVGINGRKFQFCVACEVDAQRVELADSNLCRKCVGK